MSQRLTVQLLTLRQTVVESLVQYGHNLKENNGQKNLNDPKEKVFPPSLSYLFDRV
jgi:hypothetical protein